MAGMSLLDCIRMLSGEGRELERLDTAEKQYIARKMRLSGIDASDASLLEWNETLNAFGIPSEESAGKACDTLYIFLEGTHR